MTATAYLARVAQRLKTERFQITDKITYKSQVFQYVAKRTQFKIEKFGFATTFFLFAVSSSLDVISLRGFSAESFKYAARASIIPLPRGLLYSFTCFPVVVVDAIDADTSEGIRSKAPPKHWAAFEMPVVVSLASKTLHYSEATPTWGMIYYDQMRHTISSLLAP